MAVCIAASLVITVSLIFCNGTSSSYRIPAEGPAALFPGRVSTTIIPPRESDVKLFHRLDRLRFQPGAIGRIEENEITLAGFPRNAERVTLQHARRETAAAEIFLHEADGVPGAVHKETIRRAAGERFNAELPRSGEQIEDFAPLHIKLDDIEHGLLHLIGRGADIPSHRFEQTAAAAYAGDHRMVFPR